MQDPFTGEFKCISWDTYFSFFQHKIIQEHISKNENHFVFLFLNGYYQQFKVKKLPQTLHSYFHGQKQYDSFCTYRLAEIYNSYDSQNVQPNREKSWFYILKTSVINTLKFNSDFFNAKQKLMTAMAKNGFDIERCCWLIDKYQHPETRLILRQAFMIVYGSESQRTNAYEELMKQFELVLSIKQYWYMWDFLIAIISSEIEIKNKNFDIFRQIIYKSTPQLVKLTDIYAKQLAIMLMFKAEDNLIISKMRDNIKTLITLIKLFRFAHSYRDIHITHIQKNVLSMLKLIYQSLSKVKILQDRVFFTFYYCELLSKLNVSLDIVNTLMTQLESMIMIKSQLGFLGFFYYLKYRIYPEKQTLQLSKRAFERQIDDDGQNQNRMMVYYYLGSIYKKLNQNQKYEQLMEKGYQLYEKKKQIWSQLTFKGYFCYMRIKRELKRMNYNLNKHQIFTFPTPYLAVTQKQHLKHIKKSQQKIQYKFEDIKILEVLAVEAYQLYLAKLRQQLCTICKYSFLSQQQVQTAHKELSSKSLVEHHNIIPILNVVYQQLDNQFYNLYVIFPPCCPNNDNIMEFEQMVEQCWKLSKAHDYYSRKIGQQHNQLIKMYSASGQAVLLRCLSIKDNEVSESSDYDKMFDKLKNQFLIEFIHKQLSILKKQQLTEFLEQIYLNI